MKKLLLLISLFFVFNLGYAQFPISQSLGSSKTLVTSKGGLSADSALILPVFSDTAAANTSPYVKYYAGNMIRVGDNVYIRNSTATAWILLGGTGTIPNLQQVTDVGDTTTNSIIIDGGDLNMDGGNIVLRSDLGSNISWTDNINTISLQPQFPTSNGIISLPDTSGTIVLSVNGNFADSKGNITIPTATTPNLQQVTDVNDTTTNDIYVNSLNLYDAASDGYGNITNADRYWLFRDYDGITRFAVGEGGLSLTNSNSGYTVNLNTENLTQNRALYFPNSPLVNPSLAPTLAVSVNGNFANSSGNITLSTGGITTADNGLTANTSTNVQLGGTLNKNTTINGSSYNYTLSWLDSHSDSYGLARKAHKVQVGSFDGGIALGEFRSSDSTISLDAKKIELIQTNTSSDTSTYKPLGVSSAGVIAKMNNWISGGGSGTVYVDSIYRTQGIDSIYYKKNGNTYAIKDSVGNVGGGGGGGKIYYFNGSVSMGTFGGIAMYELGDTAKTGTAANFTRATTGNIANFITDVNKPGLLQIPAGVWTIDTYLSEAGGGSNHAQVYAILEKWNGSTITTIATSPVEEITNGNTPDLYTYTISVPTTTLASTDRIIIQFYIQNTNGKTVTLYTQNGYVGEVHTTFTTGIGALNGLTAPSQSFATGTSGTDFNISSATSTHTFNLPTASATNRGALSSTDWTTFNDKIGAADTSVFLRKTDSSTYYTKYRSDTSRTNIYSAIDNKFTTPTGWTNYLSSSTIVGGTAASGVINYIVMGKILFVQVNMAVNSNATNFSFTLPYTNGTSPQYALGRGLNNTTTQGNVSFYMAASTNVVTLLFATSNIGLPNSWVATGGKSCQGFMILNIP